jgi:hypothetical protein
MAESIVAAMRDEQAGAVRTEREDKYEPKAASGENWAMLLGDCVERIKAMPTARSGFSVFSPPFASRSTRTAQPRDMGNCSDYDQFFEHFSGSCRRSSFG